MTEGFAKYNQSLIIRSHKNRLPALPQKSFFIQNVEDVKKQEYQNRLHELEGSIRLLQKKYKQNLKQGFENKIKSFRLQAVMQRKVIKATIEDTKKQIQQQERRQKVKRAQSEREREAKRNQSISERKEYQKKKVRQKADLQKDEIKQKIRLQQQRLQMMNKQVHDRIITDEKLKDRKKVYFETLKKSRNSRELEQEKKQCISRIIENKQILAKLQNQLQIITNDSKSKQYINKKFNQSPFITI